MLNTEIINDNICRVKIPYEGIFTTVYTVDTGDGVLLFDTGSYDEDVEGYIMPFLEKVGIKPEMVKYVFISHNHKDHAGGLERLMKVIPGACIITGSPVLKDKFADYNVLLPEDGEIISEILKVIKIPGHTQDSCAIFDTRTNTLVCGDCLQLYGIFGSGVWGANISFPKEHTEAVNKLKNMDIERISTAHDYHPYGQDYIGKEEVEKALDSCTEPFDEIKEIIKGNPALDDDEICNIYNDTGKPTLGKHVVTAVRGMLC